MNIAILGFGREGKSVFEFLKNSNKFKKSGIAILDQKFDKNYLKNLQSFDLVFRSPGVPYNLPEIQSAISKGVVFSSATKLFFEHCPTKNIIGVTGTKGKSTTSTLIYKILKKSGFDVWLAGNMGKPATDILPKITKKSWIVLELSSFQLQDLEKSPCVSVVLDTFPDHLDAHKNAGEYLSAKSNIAKHQQSRDTVFYFNDNAWSSKIAQKSRGKKTAVAGEPFGIKKNFLMAASVAAYLGCPIEKIYKTLRGFKGLEHRLEFVRSIWIEPRKYAESHADLRRKFPHRSTPCPRANISYYNDSASTNPNTTQAAISFFDRRPNNAIVLIAGGKDKNLDYGTLAKALNNSNNVKSIILFGENRDKIKKILPAQKFQIETAENLEAAVAASHQNARIHLNNTSARDMSQFPRDQGATTKVCLLHTEEESTQVLRKLAISRAGCGDFLVPPRCSCVAVALATVSLPHLADTRKSLATRAGGIIEMDSELAQNGDSVTVVFSPGAASFDMFKDYKDRGKKFKQLVNKIREK